MDFEEGVLSVEENLITFVIERITRPPWTSTAMRCKRPKKAASMINSPLSDKPTAKLKNPESSCTENSG
ncbi:MAG: hypothetical protein IKL00_01865 [Oscillospiraceae bacterium]|nr:hypothetical protein [Oscillospiraceae bacterium]